MTDITTLKDLRKAIGAAKDVLVQPRFGASEKWVRISKADALALIKGQPEASPEEMEMYSGAFATVCGPSLYLG